MNVGEELGIDGRVVPEEVATVWDSWVQTHPRLGNVAGVANLRKWLRSADEAEVDEVLCDLACLASIDGEDDRTAAIALVWALVPSARILARRLRSLSPRIDQIIAEHLWIRARTFPWHRRRAVAANIMADVRSDVLRECGALSDPRRLDRVWSATICLPDTSRMGMRHPDQSAVEELADLMTWACDTGVISQRDRDMLNLLVEAGYEADLDTRSDRGLAGLGGNRLSEAVGAQCGLSARTVRRRTRAAIVALASAATAYAEVA